MGIADCGGSFNRFCPGSADICPSPAEWSRGTWTLSPTLKTLSLRDRDEDGDEDGDGDGDEDRGKEREGWGDEEDRIRKKEEGWTGGEEGIRSLESSHLEEWMLEQTGAILKLKGKEGKSRKIANLSSSH